MQNAALLLLSAYQPLPTALSPSLAYVIMHAAFASTHTLLYGGQSLWKILY